MMKSDVIVSSGSFTERDLRARLTFRELDDCEIDDAVVAGSLFTSDLDGNLSAFEQFASLERNERAAHLLLGLPFRGGRAIVLSYVVQRAIAFDCAHDLALMARAGLCFQEIVCVGGFSNFAEMSMEMDSPLALQFLIEHGGIFEQTEPAQLTRAYLREHDRCGAVLVRHANKQVAPSLSIEEALADPRGALRALDDDALLLLFVEFSEEAKTKWERVPAMLDFLLHMDFSQKSHCWCACLLVRILMRLNVPGAKAHQGYRSFLEAIAKDDAFAAELNRGIRGTKEKIIRPSGPKPLVSAARHMAHVRLSRFWAKRRMALSGTNLCPRPRFV